MNKDMNATEEKLLQSLYDLPIYTTSIEFIQKLKHFSKILVDFLKMQERIEKEENNNE